MSDRSDLDVVIVGAGFAGLFMLHRVRGLGFSARVIEAGDGVGGTWYWNRYPGARCDIESMQYSYQFSEALQQEWEWSERYASQPEILAYANHVADRFELRPDIQFETRVQSASYDEPACRWTIVTDRGDALSARFLVMATGCLSSARIPDFPGLASFTGPTYHTGRWPHEGVDFTGQRVGVIGTGSSGIQSIPIIAREARELVVFQRTASYSVPAHNGPIDDDERRAIKADYAAFRARNLQTATAVGSRLPMGETSALAVTPEERQKVYEERWEQGGLQFLGAYIDLLIDPNANDTAAEFVRTKIADVVGDPELAARLTPKTVIGCKRLCVDTGYFETFNRDNVELVDVSETPIGEITAGGLRIGAARFRVRCHRVRDRFRRDDRRAAQHRHPRSRRAVAPGRLGCGPAHPSWPRRGRVPEPVHDLGARQPVGAHDMIVSIEQHVNWIADCIAYLRDHQYAAIEATPDAQDAWVDWVNMIADFTLFPSCNSWYLGANVPGKPARVHAPDRLSRVRREVRRRRREGLRGFRAVAGCDLAGAA